MYRLFLFILLVLIGSPNITAAYEVTNRAALRIDERHTLYLISYAFGHEKYGFKLPSEANRGAKQDNVLGYELQTPEGLTVRDGLAVSHIYSNTPKSGTEFITPTGTSTAFTLVVLHQKASSTSRANTLTVTSLPFKIGTQTSKLMPHELKSYTVSAAGTPAVDTAE